MADDKRLINFFQEKPYLITLALAGVLVLVVGLAIVGIGLGRSGGAEIEIREAEPQASESAGTIYVDVGGAVMRPGLYQLKSDSRVNDALVAGGGLAKDADRDWISQNLNLAAKLTDGIKVYLPFQGEATEVLGSADQLEGKININTASLNQLDLLWGVGPATAQKIIDNRPYAKVEDLLDKKAVKANVYEAIKDKITVL
ncbi:MAG: ComEA family DNA-binding protein [Candidatus Beckwithbacteria bacterium]|nr:ComEA family DNA-binding protein [Candidatus Beckwithbacteria bacterium]